MFRAVYALAVLLTQAPSGPGVQPIDLVREGKSAYSICLSSAASPSERHGAEELQKFLEEISGARLPIVSESEGARENLILVGRSSLTDAIKPEIGLKTLGDEGFTLRTSGRRLVIAGGRLRGTLYGVYSFLEQLGCRWFTPEVTRIPRSPTIRIGPLNESHKPAFEYREPFFTEAFDRDWAVRNKVNGASMKLDEAAGGKVSYYPFVHSFYTMIPPEKYFQARPEYFSLIDGRRRYERGQLCLTNPDLLRESVRNVLGWIREHPEARIYSVSQNDWTGWCECDQCRRVVEEEGGVHSGPLLRFVNALAAEIEKLYPDKLIDTLAYWYTEEPPAKVRPRANVRIRLCPIGTCDAHPYEMCPRNAYFMKNLRAWSRITNQLYIWHYNTNFAHYLAPFPDFDELAADIPMYKRQGVVGLFMEGAYPEGGGGENAGLRSYLMARLLWDTGADANAAITEFLQGVYGKAAPAMREYFDWIHRQVRFPPSGLGHHLHIFMQTGEPHLSAEFLSRAREILGRAQQQAEDEAVRRRVQQARMSVDYVQLMQARRFVFQDGRYAPPDAGGLRDRYRQFIETVRSFGITRLRESTKLEDDESAFYRSLQSYSVASLEDAHWRVDLVAELNGRIVRMIDKRTGMDLLVSPDSGQLPYPNLGGLTLSVYPDYHSRQAVSVRWQVDAVTGREINLRGTAENGLLVRRTVSLGDDGMVHLRTAAENAGSGEINLALQTRLDLDPGRSVSPVVAFRRQDGGAWERRLSELDRDPSGPENFLDGGRPDGELRLMLPASNCIVRFPADQAARAYLIWSLRTTRNVTFGLWSAAKALKPGEILYLNLDVASQPAGR
jgi:hypothetical protein